MSWVKLVAVVLAAALVSACASDGTNSLKGLGIGSNVPPTPGVAPRGILGGGLGQGLAEADRKLGLDAEISALETGGPGSPVGWRGDANTRGTVIAGPPYSRPGYQTCRDYSHTIYVQDKPQLARGAACRTPEGTWAPVG